MAENKKAKTALEVKLEETESLVKEIKAGPKVTSLVEDIFGGSLKYWRELRDLTQDAVTAKMVERGFDFHQSTLYKIESGKRRVLLSEGMALSEILDVPLSRLTEPEVNSEPSLLASLKFGARLELDALERAINAVTDLGVAAQQVNMTVAHLEEESGEKVFDFNGTLTTAREFYEPLAMPNLKPVIEHLERVVTEAKEIDSYLGA